MTYIPQSYTNGYLLLSNPDLFQQPVRSSSILRNHQTEFCFTLILQINNATVMKTLIEITVLTLSVVQLCIDHILKKLMGPVSNLIYFTHSTYIHSSTARNLEITWLLIREGCFSCVISPYSQTKADWANQIKECSKTSTLVLWLGNKGYTLSSAYKILSEILLTYQNFNTDWLEQFCFRWKELI